MATLSIDEHELYNHRTVIGAFCFIVKDSLEIALLFATAKVPVWF